MGRILHKTRFGFLFWCRGCGHGHGVWLHEPNPVTGATWAWNGSEDSPTFTPSILIQAHARSDGTMTPQCHLFVRDGSIEYCGDSTHELAGKTVPMAPF